MFVCLFVDAQPESQSLKRSKTLEGHRRGASFCCFSPNGKHLLVCGSNEPQEVKVWNVEVRELALICLTFKY